jgi:hypothetical protein
MCFVALGIVVGGRVGMDELQAGRAVSEFEKWASICVCNGNSAAIVVFFLNIIVGRGTCRYYIFGMNCGVVMWW